MLAIKSLYTRIFIIITLLASVLIWPANPYCFFSSSLRLHTLLPLFLWASISATFLTLPKRYIIPRLTPDITGISSLSAKHPQTGGKPIQLAQPKPAAAGCCFETGCRGNIQACPRYNPGKYEIEANPTSAPENPSANKWLHYLSCIQDNIHESIIILSTKGEVLFINGQARDVLNKLGRKGNYSSTDVHALLFMSAADFQIVQAQIVQNKSWHGEGVLPMGNDSRHYMHRINPLGENDVIEDMVIISTDITELVRSREHARSANMVKNQFLANMSHELRTPMIGIMGAADLLAESRLDMVQRENVEIIRTCGEGLLKLINEILDMSKIELDLHDLHLKECNPVELIMRLVNNLQPILEDKGLQLKLDISADFPSLIKVDEVKLRQILTNVLNNAVKFTLRGYITLTARIKEEQGQSYLCLDVVDTGIGIAEAEFDKIFEAFTQIDYSASRSYGGTGLGLYICKRFIEEMKGTIHLDSEEGVGTTFYIKIPVEIISDQVPALAITTVLPGHAGEEDTLGLGFHSIRVLLVEDNELNQKIVSQMLVNYGFEATLASNGLECLRKLKKNYFDIILMDMQMPIMDGYEATRMIRQSDEFKNIPVVAMTAHTMAGAREKCLASGCTSYIAKPFKGEELAQELKRHFNSHAHSIKNSDPKLVSFINDLLPEFMSQLEEMLENLQKAYANRDLEVIKSISHDIKGTAGMYGFGQISRTAAAAEEAASEMSFPKIKSALEQLYLCYEAANTEAG